MLYSNYYHFKLNNQSYTLSADHKANVTKKSQVAPKLLETYIQNCASGKSQKEKIFKLAQSDKSNTIQSLCQIFGAYLN